MVNAVKSKQRTLFTFPNEGTYPNGSHVFLYKNVRINGAYDYCILNYNGVPVAVINSGDNLETVLTDINGKSIGGLLGACFNVFSIDVCHSVGEEVSIEYDSMEPMENIVAEYLLNGFKIMYGHGSIGSPGGVSGGWGWWKYKL
jgi:hypothetical protein